MLKSKLDYLGYKVLAKYPWLRDSFNKPKTPEDIYHYANDMDITNEDIQYYIRISALLSRTYSQHMIKELHKVARRYNGNGVKNDILKFREQLDVEFNQECGIMTVDQLYSLYWFWSKDPISKQRFLLYFLKKNYYVPNEGKLITALLGGDLWMKSKKRNINYTA